MSKKQSTKSMERKSIKQRITGISKKKIVSIVVLAIVMITAIIAIVINQVNTQNLKRNESATNGDESAQALTKNETEETQNDDSNGIALYASNTSQQGAEAVWAQGIGGTSNEKITSVVECSNGSYIVGGCYSSNIDLGNEISLTEKGDSDGMVIKYSSSGKVEWAKTIGGTSSDYIEAVAECSDGGYIVGGYFYSSSIDLESGVNLTREGGYNGMLIKYSSSGKLEWAKGIGGSDSVYITSVSECEDGGHIVGGYFSGRSIDLENGISLTNKSLSTSYTDGLLLKYNSSGKLEWALGIGGTDRDYIESVRECSDGGYIVGGYFYSSSIDLGNRVSLNNQGADDGMVIKYNKRGEVEWAHGIGNNSSDAINSVAETSDGCYIAGGYFLSDSIDLENRVSLLNHYGESTCEGMIIKYNSGGKVEWAKTIGGTSSDYIKSVAKCSDGGCIVGGYFESTSMDLGNEISLTRNPSSNCNGMIIKYGSDGEVEWAERIGGTYGEYIESVGECNDGGCIVGGYFKSSNIDLGNGISLTNKTGGGSTTEWL